MTEFLKSDDADNLRVRDSLRKYNREHFSITGDYCYHVKDGDALVAGIVAYGTLDALEVELLYVDEAYRGKGLGASLLAHAEDMARKDGLVRVLLNTYSFQAPGFYEKLGYARLFEISPCFGEYSQYYYMKML